MKRHDYAVACPKLAESQRLDPATGTLFNLAACERQLGRLATAWTLFRELVDTTPARDPRVPLARQRIAELGPLLPKIKIVTPDAPEGATVLLDDVELGLAGLHTEIPVDPGPHRIVFRAQGFPPEAKDVVAVEQELRIVEFQASTPDAAMAAAPPRSVEAVDPASNAREARPTDTQAAHEETTPPLRYVAYGVAGTGIAALIASAAFTGMALSSRSTVNDRCDGRECDAKGLEAARRGSRLLTAADVALVAGIAGVSIGGLLFWESTRVDAAIAPGNIHVAVRMRLP